MKDKKSVFGKEFTRGFCLAIAEVSRYGATDRECKAALDAAGYSLDEIKKADVPDFDLDQIKCIYKNTDKRR